MSLVVIASSSIASETRFEVDLFNAREGIHLIIYKVYVILSLQLSPIYFRSRIE